MATLKEIMNLTPDDINRMNRHELVKIVSQMSSASNKRLKRLGSTEVGQMSPAYKYMEEKGKFSVKGKSTNQLRNEYVRNKHFLDRKTSSVKGWNKVREETFERIGGDFDGDIDMEKDYWKKLRELEELGYNSTFGYDSEMTQILLRKEYIEPSRSGDIMERMEIILKESYEEAQKNKIKKEVENEEFYDFEWVE